MSPNIISYVDNVIVIAIICHSLRDKKLISLVLSNAISPSSIINSWNLSCSQEVWMVFFQTCSKTHSARMPVVDSPECWGMVSYNWWYLSYFSTLKQNHWKRIGSLTYQNNSSLPLWSPFPVCIWPVYTRLYPPSCKHLLWPDGAVWVLQWTMVCHCCRLNESS